MKIPLFINSNENVGSNSDFTIYFRSPLRLDSSKRNRICLVKNSISYSWYNVDSHLNDNVVKYSPDGGNTFNTITFIDGHYEYDNLNAYIQSALEANGHSKTGISLKFENQFYRVKVTPETNYQLDVRTGNILIGFDNVIITYIERNTFT